MVNVACVIVEFVKNRMND